LREQSDDRFEVGFHGSAEIGPGLKEIFEIGSGEDQHFTRAIVSVKVITLARFYQVGPVCEVSQLFSWLLGEQVVGDAYSQLSALVKLIDDLIVFRIVLKSAARVDDARDPEAVEFPHEVAARVHLILCGQRRAFGESGVEKRRVWLGNKDTGWIAGGISNNFATRRVR
jgi:hypothetical protein